MVPTTAGPAGPDPDSTVRPTRSRTAPGRTVPTPRRAPRGAGPALDPPLIRSAGGQPAVNAQVAAAAAEFGLFAVHRPDLAAASQHLAARARAALALIDNEPATADLVTARPEAGHYAGYSPPESEALGVDGHVGGLPDPCRSSWTWTTDGPAPWDPLPQGFRVSAEEWTAAAMRLLTDRILPGLSRLLGFDLGGHYRLARGVCRYNEYPAPQAPPAPGQLRVVAHRDHAPLTLVVPDGPGLELHHAGRWLPVRWTPGQVLVNVGQELGALAALQDPPCNVAPALHRVVAPPAGGGRRSSLVCSWFGHPDTVIDYRGGAPVTSAQFTPRHIDARPRAVPQAAAREVPR